MGQGFCEKKNAMKYALKCFIKATGEKDFEVWEELYNSNGLVLDKELVFSTFEDHSEKNQHYHMS